jgi:hypothetical protein
MIIARLLPAALLLFVSAGQNAPGVPRVGTTSDTVDVPVGSPVLDTKSMQAFATHLLVHQIANGSETLMQEATNTIVFGDSAGRPVIRVGSVGEGMTPAGKAALSSHFTFDRKTLALVAMQNTTPRGDLSVAVNGLSIEVTVPTPGGPQRMSMQLSAPAFFAQWSDYVVEELPKRQGTVYRVRLWRPAMQPGAAPHVVEETHLYTIAGREDIEVLGKLHRKAWVIEDRVVGQPGLAGRMWVIDNAPKLVRWVVVGPGGSETRIDQELVTTR